MKRQISTMTILTLLLISVATLALNARSVEAETDIRMWVDPVSSTAEPGQSFVVAIMIENVPSPGAALWQFQLRYDSSILTIVNPSTDVIEGEWLGQDGLLQTYFSAKTSVLYTAVGSFLMGPGGTTGSGALAYIIFKVVGPGYTKLDLYNALLLDANSQQITPMMDDGEFYTDTPRADFEYAYRDREFRSPVVGETITFNATYDPMTYAGSYDPSPGGAIVSYRWNFGDGTIETYTTPLATHSYAQSGIYRVTLTVADNSVPSLTNSWNRILGIDLRDIAITDIEITPSVVAPGTVVSINVTVTNFGTVPEYFNVTLYYDDTLIYYNKTFSADIWGIRSAFCLSLEQNPNTPGMRMPSMLPGESFVVPYQWNTTGLPAGPYIISANASIIVGFHDYDRFFVGIEENETNNFAQGKVTIMSPAIAATVDIDPDTLNLGSKGNWITAYVQLPEGYSAADIDASTILLNGTIAPVLDPKYGFVTNSSEYLVDYNNDGILERMVRFNRTAVEDFILSRGYRYGSVTLTVAGSLYDGTSFDGNNAVLVRMPGDVNGDGIVDARDLAWIGNAFGPKVGDQLYSIAADFNSDGIIDTFDLATVSKNFGKTYL